MKALIIGSNGYLGRHLAHTLRKAGIEPVCCDIQPASFDPSFSYIPVNVSEESSLGFLNFHVDTIFMMAGLTGTAGAFEQHREFVAVNEIGLLNVLDRMRKTASRARIVFPSTRLVYRGIKDLPLDEESPKEAKTIYAANKHACEQYLGMYSQCFGINYSIFRICVPYGNMVDDAYSYGTLGFMLGQAEKENNIIVFGDGLQKRTFTHVSDISRILLEASQSRETINGCFNIGSQDHLSILEVAEAVASEFNVSVELREWPEMAFAVESGDTIFNAAKLEGVLGDSYLHTFADWLGRLRRK